VSEKDPILEEWRESIATAIGGEAADIKTVKELLECNPAGACETHGRCWTHSEWQRCGSLIQSVSGDPCAAVVDGLDGLCSGCREFKALCEQHDETIDRSSVETAPDPTTASIASQNDERDQLRAENMRLSRALVAAYTDVEVVTADRDRSSKLGDTLFVEGYDQAVREIRDHFDRKRQIEVVVEIEKIWMVGKCS
jgi:hypothetical protein